MSPDDQAKVSGPLVDLLSEHEQSLDPNLVQLAEAWQEAVVRAGGESALEEQLKGVNSGEGCQIRTCSVP